MSSRETTEGAQKERLVKASGRFSASHKVKSSEMNESRRVIADHAPTRLLSPMSATYLVSNQD